MSFNENDGPRLGAEIGFQPRIRKGAFFDACWRYGCRKFSVYNRTYISSTFSDPVSEYWQVVHAVGLWPAMGERQVEITGPDAAKFVDYLTPRDMSACAVGQCKYALITAPDGGILCDPIILQLGRDRFWVSTSDCDMELWIRGVAVGTGFDVAIRDAGVSVIQVQGPRSPAVVQRLFGDGVLDLRNYWAMEVPFEGTTLWISRTGWSGEFGYEIYLAEAAFGDALFDALMVAGTPDGIAPGSVNQAKRVEAGILSWGVDVTPEENPFEVGLGRLVDLGKASDFVGRAALTALAEHPPARQLVGLSIEGAMLAPNEDPWPLLAGDTPVGRLTTLVHSPRLDRNIGLGIVASAHAEIGARFVVETWDGPRGVVVAPLPFTPKRQAGDPRTLIAAIGE